MALMICDTLYLIRIRPWSQHHALEWLYWLKRRELTGVSCFAALRCLHGRTLNSRFCIKR